MNLFSHLNECFVKVMRQVNNFSPCKVIEELEVIIHSPIVTTFTSFHQQIAESFAQVCNGRTVTIGKEEFIIDEVAIAEITGLPRTGECWFKSTLPSNIEFRSYLLPAHKELIWKGDIPMSFLEPQ